MSGKDLDSNLVIVRTAALTSKIHGLAGDLQQGVEIIRTWCGVLENDDEKLIQALDKEILPTIEKLTALILSLQKEILLQDMEFQCRQTAGSALNSKLSEIRPGIPPLHATPIPLDPFCTLDQQ
ncbi:hypothetical protein GYMLUDRAFT_252628 [Collybiopsis luxurians FD-317 M1]|uniref:Uncharacterized protein n=1 Tax=Collybiopsis luxurians FD-317 M1 TaxID=944289 RepID=A0A0D0AKR8_9AGAR|nr:hypothetical protein GYMLUDRAFT_252628 [Collybiopsis luxurians FD-317 M1]